jgi:hypothetical protein
MGFRGLAQAPDVVMYAAPHRRARPLVRYWPMASKNFPGIDQITLDLFSSEGAPDLPGRAKALAEDRSARIQQLRTRIAKATADCASWRASGLREKYLEAYSFVESLEVELTALEDAAGRARRLEASHGR